MKIRKYNLILGMLLLVFASCSSDDVDKKNSIYDDLANTSKNAFDVWLYDNYVVPYNIELQYKYTFQESDFEYSLTPILFENAVDFSQVIKYCWLEAYDEVAGIQFMRSTSPKLITLIGGKALTSSSTAVLSTLGTAIGGTRVLLYDLNSLSDYSYSSIIEYMHIMHHEFSHILAQKTPMDTSFKQLSEEWYLGDSWADYAEIYDDANFYTKGFVTAYSACDEDEDYAEIYSQYLILTDDEWNAIIDAANEGGATGGAKIIRKLAIVKEYLLDSWELDLDDLRTSVQRRSQKAANMAFLTFDETNIY